MYLVTCEPIVFKTNPGAISGGFGFELTAVLRCPNCSWKENATPPGHIFNRGFSGQRITAEDVRQHIEWEMTEITKARDCTRCGIVSMVPLQRRVELKEYLTRIETLDYLREQIALRQQEYDAARRQLNVSTE